MTRLKVVVNNQDKLGECPLWDPQKQYLWWTDILASRLYRFNLDDKSIEQWNTPERLCSFGLHRQGGLIAAFESGFAHYQPELEQIDWLQKVETTQTHTRLNDGRCDRFGRYFAGTMIEADKKNNDGSLGGLYRLDAGGSLVKLQNDISISNSLCWSPDNTKLYFADSAAQIIWVYKYHPETGDISDQQIFATTQGNCFPDGSTIDSEGFLWNAQWGASQIVRYSSDGTIDKIIKLPVSQPSCIAFGGSDLKTLYITTARDGLDTETLKEQPLSGSVFSIRTSVAGLEEGRFG